ncbi:protein FAM91A1-like [Panicum miliaceum]|uniref:Protein FAM91A1-like n=1 Tax=Panicum miliaceum TaxID=4540 RepID=A0A3L6SGJ9_PANMI|nr:protein FAM91A1-like [Panicum miliaceum]
MGSVVLTGSCDSCTTCGGYPNRHRGNRTDRGDQAATSHPGSHGDPISLQSPATRYRGATGRAAALDPGTAASLALPNLTCLSSPPDRNLIPPQRSSSQIRPPHPTTSLAGGGWTRCSMSSATVEEQMVVKAIREECPWESLPKRLQSTLQTKEEWHRRTVDFCIRKRLQWNTCFARRVCREGEYYEEMMRYLRRNLALYPYHLADYICRVSRISPFRYYCDILFEAMKNEQPYDSIPNFTAADALRLTGVGRNEFIDIMNKCRSKKLMWKLNKSIAKEMLPTQPVDFPVEPWWGVCLVNFTLEEFKKLSEEETATIDKICKEEANSYVLFDPKVIDGLYKRGLVYFDVPVFPDDRFKVSRLENFVSNKDQSYEDPIEELLYAVFVVSSANATVAELAATLQADLYQLQAAASFACRLGWAVKLVDADSVLNDEGVPAFPGSILSDDEEGSNTSINSEKSGQQLTSMDSDGPRKISGTAHVGFVVDANVTSYLMMGSLSPGLKSHAVTLYEAGKLGDSCIAELCSDLASLEGKKFEGVLEEFANHAFSLRYFLECLRSGGVSSNEISNDAGEAKTPRSSLHDIENATSQLAKVNMEGGADDNHDELPQHNQVTCNLDDSDGNIMSPTVATSELDVSSDTRVLKNKRKYKVDILRCESLASLAPATLERLFLRDYDVIVSMVPLPSSSVLPGPSGPIHFGPPSYSSMTPWMKLVLYTAGNCGPVSAVFMKGLRFRLLPEPLAGCEKVLIWSWDGSVVGGLGGKFEGNLVKGNLLLHCLNSMLKQSAVLVQPLNVNDLDTSGNLVTVEIPLPLKNDDQSIACVIAQTNLPKDQILNLTSVLKDLSSKFDLSTLGYLRLVRLHRIDESDKIDPENKDDLNEHCDVMQNVRKRLRELCSEYQATGPIAKLFNKRGSSRDLPRILINSISGRWNPNNDPSTPTGGAPSENERLKFSGRQRCRTEVVSFDGSTVRSYALAPELNEAASRPTSEEQPSLHDAKSDTEDTDSKDVVLPGLNLIFDGAELHPFDVAACLQARQPLQLIAEASAASSALL